MGMKIPLLVVSACLLNFMPAAAQQPAKDDANGPFALNVGVRLVEIPVSVQSSVPSTPLDNLQRSNFQVFEDGVAQDITLFKHEDIPLRVGLVFRVGTLPDRKERIDAAAKSFVQESNPNSKTFVLDFDASPYYRSTDFKQGITDMVESFVDAPGTSTQNGAAETNVKKAVLVIANVDGNDSALAANGIRSLLNYFQESNDITIYAIGLQTENGKAPSKTVRDNFTQIAAKTGGDAYFPVGITELHDISRRIAHELRNRYLLGYSPKNLKTDGAWRSIRVSITSVPTAPRTIVRAKQGYFAPTE